MGVQCPSLQPGLLTICLSTLYLSCLPKLVVLPYLTSGVVCSVVLWCDVPARLTLSLAFFFLKEQIWFGGDEGGH